MVPRARARPAIFPALSEGRKWTATGILISRRGQGAPRSACRGDEGSFQTLGRMGNNSYWRIRLRGPTPAGDRYSSRGQRPRKGRTSPPDPEGVASVWAARHKAGVTPPGFDPFRVGACGGVFRGRCPRLLSCALAGHRTRPRSTAGDHDRLKASSATARPWTNPGSRDCAGFATRHPRQIQMKWCADRPERGPDTRGSLPAFPALRNFPASLVPQACHAALFFFPIVCSRKAPCLYWNC